VIPWAMLPDVTELDELETGQRREGVFYAIFIMAQKIALALALSCSNYAIGFAGYVKPEPGDEKQYGNQPEDVLFTLRFLLGIVPIVGSVLSCFFLWMYPITKERHEEIKRLIAEKKRNNGQGGVGLFEDAPKEKIISSKHEQEEENLNHRPQERDDSSHQSSNEEK